MVVTGFQGVNRYGDMTTLGRGGSDTSAVAIAATMHADLCQIFTDVDGVYTADPRKIPGAIKLSSISYDEMLELATLGAGAAQPLGGNGQAIQRQSGGSLQLHRESGYES